MVLPDFDGASDIVDVTMDARGQLLDVTREYPDGPGTTSYTWDANGNRTSITDPRGQVMSFDYDTYGRMTTYVDKHGQSVEYTYDEAGRELTRINRNGEVLARTYDLAGRLQTLVGPGVDREWHYDALGRTTYARAGGHVEERTYDGVHLSETRVYGLDGAGHIDATWQLAFDDASRLATMEGPFTAADVGLTVDHGYDHRGRLSAVTELALGTWGMGYDTVGRMDSLTRPDGTVTTTTYDDAGRTLGTVTTDALGTVLHEVLTTYDTRGLPDTQTDPFGTLDYTHDVAGRLVGVDHPATSPIADELYAYDAANRRTESHRDAASEVVYNDLDQLVQDASYTYVYDAEGRLIEQTDRATGGVTTFAYDALDHMIGMVDEAGTAWTYVFDARELRVLVTAEQGGVETYGEAFV